MEVLERKKVASISEMIEELRRLNTYKAKIATFPDWDFQPTEGKKGMAHPAMKVLVSAYEPSAKIVVYLENLSRDEAEIERIYFQYKKQLEDAGIGVLPGSYV